MTQHRRRVRTKGPATPLKQVRLHNFKSVRDAQVELRPLTAIVGRNSSGKSTLLQGILALAQAAKLDDAGRLFPLNGDLVRLGTFDEVRSFDAPVDGGIQIGFTAEFSQRGFGRQRPGDPEPELERNTVDWDAHLGASRDGQGSPQAMLETIEFSTRSATPSATVAHVSLAVNSIDGESTSLQQMGRSPFPFSRGSEVVIEGRVTDLISGQSSSVDSMTITGGLPLRVTKTERQFEVVFRRWWDTVHSALEDDRMDARRQIAEGLADDERAQATRKSLDADVKFAVKFAKEAISAVDYFDSESAFTPQVRHVPQGFGAGPVGTLFHGRLARLTEKNRRQLASAMNELDFGGFRSLVHAALVNDGADWLDAQIKDEPIGATPLALQNATSALVSLFQQVRYLGPLRAKPQVNYRPGIGQIDLGPEGEFSAAILHANAQRQVLVPLPSGGSRPMALGEGLNLWLEELGLASTAEAKDKGRLGIGLEVRPVGRTQSVDLTSVGVGVSQALPVVLLCLIAPPESIILLEQPELHLHPDMQLRLADFLLACVLTGRQIVLETHSEHLINRLRRRVAEDETSVTSSAIRLLFADQRDGVTTYSVSDINEVGGLSTDWPKGFLDVASDESTRLLQQSLAKKRANVEKSL